jgi:hypothetical protein
MKTMRSNIGRFWSVTAITGLCLWLGAAVGASGADLWFDSATNSGIQPATGTTTGGFSWADAPLGNSMWATNSAGTTNPVQWTANSSAFFTAAGTATVTVDSATANFLTFSSGAWIFHPGTGALTINGGMTNVNQSLKFYTDLLLGGAQTWALNGSTTIMTGKVSGVASALYPVSKTGNGTLVLSNALNQFSGVVIKEGSLTAYNNSLGNSAGTPLTIGATDQLLPGKVTLDTTVVGNNTVTLGNLTNAGTAALIMANTAATSTNIVQAQKLVREGRGTLLLAPPAVADLGGKDQVYFTGGTTMVNGIFEPWLAANPSGGAAIPDFVRYTPTGVVVAAYQTTNWSSTKVISTAATTLTANVSAYALKTAGGAGVTVNPGVTLTLGDGTFAGLHLNGQAILGGGTLSVGAAELIVGVGSTHGTIATTIDGTGGLTLNSPLSLNYMLTLSNMTYTGDTWVNGGTLRVAPASATTYTNAIRGAGAFTKLSSPGSLTLRDGPIALGGAMTFSGSDAVFSTTTVTNIAIVSGDVVLAGLSNNVAVLANTDWTVNSPVASDGLKITGTGNVFTVNGGTFRQLLGNSSIFHAGGGSFNSVIVSNGGVLNITGTSITVGNGHNNLLQVGGLGAYSSSSNNSTYTSVGNIAGNSGNQVLVTNAWMWARGVQVGGTSGTTSNSLTVDRNGTLAAGNGSMMIGAVGATGNVVTVRGGTITNCATFSIGGNNSGFGGHTLFSVGNSLTISEGGAFYSSGIVYVGPQPTYGRGCINNAYTVGGAGLPSIATHGVVMVGCVSNGCNTLTVTNATLTSPGTGNVIGDSSTNNTATVAAGGTWDIGTYNLTAGINSAGGSSAGNVVSVQPGGVLKCGGLITGAGAGNLITNSSGVYEFKTVTPTITISNGPGSIAVNSGVISFVNVANANVTNNWRGSQLTNITFSGDNAFRLNNATNNTAGSQDYVFNTGRGSTNYAGLEMVNGNTAYTNGTVTIGTGGWLTFSNTTAIMWGLVTNSGTLTLVNSTVSFKTNLTMTAGALSVGSTNNLPLTVNGVLTLGGTVAVTLPASIGRNDTFTLFDSPNYSISGSVSGWTMPATHRLVMSENSLVVLPRMPGFIFMVD